jgi:hypothetical protein
VRIANVVIVGRNFGDFLADAVIRGLLEEHMSVLAAEIDLPRSWMPYIENLVHPLNHFGGIMGLLKQLLHLDLELLRLCQMMVTLLLQLQKLLLQLAIFLVLLLFALSSALLRHFGSFLELGFFGFTGSFTGLLGELAFCTIGMVS